MHNTIFEKYSINRLILTFSLPATLSLIIETLTTVVDTAFAGHIKDNSLYALSALGLLNPLLAIFTSLQTLFAFSTALMITKYLGQNNQLKVNNHFMSGFYMTLLISSLSSLISFLFMNSIFFSLGITGKVNEVASDYLNIILISNVFSSIGYTLTSCIRAFGHPVVEMVIISLSVLMNVVFNSLFTFVFHLGIIGIAAGTLISEMACAIISIMYLRRYKLWFKWNKLPLKEHFTMVFHMFKLRIAQTIIQSLAGMTSFFINNQLLSLGGNSAIAVWNIANKLYMLALMPIIGMTQGIQTIIAYFDGKREETKKQIVINKTIVYCIVYGVSVAIFIFSFGDKTLYLFTANKELLISVVPVIRVIFITFPLLGITYTLMTVLQVTGKETQAVLLGVIRQLISFIPLILLLPIVCSKVNIFHISPVFSIFFAVPLADLITLGFAFLFFQSSSLSNQTKVIRKA
ncbi:MATE family efflux transporter [Bacillus sp. REN10]|uniref:MATE family efflux transporter n=1 Tax=Bacillus sp. REN10 TaxID=2782541 RepID=UPI00193C11E9|nr:MATE family efflux transporter [Bacillus sp. REN10]